MTTWFYSHCVKLIHVHRYIVIMSSFSSLQEMYKFITESKVFMSTTSAVHLVKLLCDISVIFCLVAWWIQSESPIISFLQTEKPILIRTHSTGSIIVEKSCGYTQLWTDVHIFMSKQMILCHHTPTWLNMHHRYK